MRRHTAADIASRVARRHESRAKRRFASCRPSTRPDALAFDEPRPVWLKLEVLWHRPTGPDSAEVEFVARYRVGGGSVVRMRERSRFLREDGNWFYLDAVGG